MIKFQWLRNESMVGSRNHRYDLKERTATFGETVVRFAERLPTSPVVTPLIGQLVRAGTSVGANYVEAGDAHSKKEFLLKLPHARRRRRKRNIGCA